jgi:hypothetical protein
MLRLNSVAFGFIAFCLSLHQALGQGVGMPGAAAPPGGSAFAPPPAAPPPEAAPPAAALSPADQWRLTAPMEMRYVDGRAIPPGYHLETRARRGLVVSGPIIFGVPYVLSASVAASSQYDPDRWLYLPVVGPFADLGARGSQCSRNSFTVSPGVTSTTETCVNDSASRFFLMLDGLMQTAGATMLILGLALPSHLLVRDDAPYSGSAGTPVIWSVQPRTMGRGGYGVSIDGFF